MTDRVELTEDEAKVLTKAAKLLREAKRYWQDQPNAAAARSQANRLFAGVVAARLSALTAERDEALTVIQGYQLGLDRDQLRRERDAARAELAAANARCAELDEKLDRLSTEIMDQNAEKWGDQPLTDDEKALLLRFNALSVVLDKSEAKNAALQATLDRVTAAIKSSKHKTTDHEGTVTGYLISDAELRAALTPEGKRDGCGVCLTCDPPQDDPRFGFPIMQRMYVCGTCGNKRCPAAGDCLKWECSGSNATNQVPVLRTPEGTE